MRFFRLLTISSLALLLLSCGGGGKRRSLTPPVPDNGTPAFQTAAPQQTTVAEALAELDALEVPEGVDAEVFSRLKDALAEQLRTLNAERGTSKLVSAPPAGESNRVTDLIAADNGNGTATLMWSYRNTGDYNQDGIVNISDITPLAVHFNESSDASNEWIDGNGDTMINISDITPLAANFFNECAGYAVESSDNPDSGFTQEDTASFSGAFGTGRLQFQHTLTLAAGMWVRVVPLDSASASGIESAAAPVAATGGGAQVTIGTTSVLTNQTIGPNGGTIEGPLGTALEGVSVTFPPGALSEEVNVQLGVNDGSITPAWGDFGGVIISLDTGDVHDFAQPVDVTVPYTDDSAIPVPYYIDPEGGLHVMQLISADAGAGTATFQTFHASLVTWINDLLGLDPQEVAYTTYRPADDGFQVVNNGSYYHRNGECSGMTSFSLWYYEHHLASGHLFPRFMYTVDPYHLTGQDIIATRAFTSIAQQWSVYRPIVIAESELTDEQNYAIIRNAILNTTSPVMLYVYWSSGFLGAAHSVLAWGYDQGVISLYDPNFPGENRTATYDTLTRKFRPYYSGNSSYDGILYNGDGSLHVTESYSNILNDAENQFAGSCEAMIRDIYPENESEITERYTTLSGTIDSGQLLVNELRVWNGSISFRVDVPEDGYFEVTIPIDHGANFIWFDTISHGRSVSNNMDGEIFTLEGVFGQAAILVTLTWDKNDTDVDLYVTDPTGEWSWFNHPTTADGGVLDVDDIDGYGPEHWTLTYSDTVRWGEAYDVYLHYYWDHGNGGTNWQVSILLYEGSPDQVVYTYSGYLSVNNSDNDNPDEADKSAKDWVDIATITPVEHSPSSLGGWTPSVRTGIGGIPHITVPVPPPSMRTK